MVKKSVIAKISFGAILLIAQAFLLVNAKIFFPNNTGYWQSVILVYIVLEVLIASIPKTRRDIFSISFVKAWPKMLLFAGITFAALTLFNIVSLGGKFVLPVLTPIIIGVLLVHGFIVAVVEETIFRDLLLDIGRKIGLAIILIAVITSVLFALFHFGVYGGNWISLSWAFILGIIFFYTARKFGLGAAMGVHWGYNVWVLGLFPFVIASVI